ncbi:hypothetical protein I552_9687 [Mycobacterium xenopi 3993]|nr:hypothetical protein I552_9687 [Mycobacterium xenopi 3993]
MLSLPFPRPFNTFNGTGSGAGPRLPTATSPIQFRDKTDAREQITGAAVVAAGAATISTYPL